MTKRTQIILGALGLTAIVGAIAYSIGSQKGLATGIDTGKSQASDLIKLALQQGIDANMTLGEFYQSAFPDSTPDETTHL